MTTILSNFKIKMRSEEIVKNLHTNEDEFLTQYMNPSQRTHQWKEFCNLLRANDIIEIDNKRLIASNTEIPIQWIEETMGYEEFLSHLKIKDQINKPHKKIIRKVFNQQNRALTLSEQDELQLIPSQSKGVKWWVKDTIFYIHEIKTNDSIKLKLKILPHNLYLNFKGDIMI